MIAYIKKVYSLYPKSVWYLTLLQLLFVARITIFATGGRTIGDYSVTMNSSTSLILAVISISLIVIYKEYKCFKSANRRISKLLVFYYLCLFSFLWAGLQTVIFFKAIEVLCNIYLMYIIASKIGNVRLLLLYIIMLSTIVTYVEVFGGMRKFGIGFFHTNSYSMSAMIGFLLGLQTVRCGVFKLRTIRLFLILDFLAILGGTSSATFISVILGLILVYSSDDKGMNLKLLLISMALFSCLWYVGEDAIFNFIFQGKSETDIETGTGRTYVIEAALRSWKDSPILGHGYIIGERSLILYGLGFKALTTHNTFLAILVDTGIVGMIVFLNFLCHWIYTLIERSKDNIIAVILFPAVIASLVNCLSYPAIGADWNYVGSLIFLLYIMSNLYIKGYSIKVLSQNRKYS